MRDYIYDCSWQRSYTAADNNIYVQHEGSMVIEICGLRPTSHLGDSFNRGIWKWRPIWDYIYNSHPDLASKIDDPFYPDGEGLDDVDSEELARRLEKDLESGVVADYARTLEEFARLAPNLKCAVCGGSGVRNDEAGRLLGLDALELEPDVAVRLQRGRGWCDACDGVGETDRSREIYKFDVDDLNAFRLFLLRCGGFEIW